METIKTPIYVKLTEDERKTRAMPMTFLMNCMMLLPIMTVNMWTILTGMTMTDRTLHLRLMCFKCLPLLKRWKSVNKKCGRNPTFLFRRNSSKKSFQKIFEKKY